MKNSRVDLLGIFRWSRASKTIEGEDPNQIDEEGYSALQAKMTI